MDELLILGGLLLIIGGLTWLIRRAFSVSLFWGLGSLLPPMTLVFVLFKWQKSSSPVTLMAFGFIPLVVGFAMLANHDSERLEAVLQLSWLKSEVNREPTPELRIQLRGELNGHPFIPQEGELIGSVLTLRERNGASMQQEIRIHLPSTSSGRVHINILPEDQGQLPLIEISRSASNLTQPENQHLVRGYTLHLDLEPQAPNLLVGSFHLVLPRQFRTSLSGRVELFASRLRYRNGKVNLHFDSEETLAYVIRDYLARRFVTDAVQLYGLSRVSLPSRHLEIDVAAFINDKAHHFLVNMGKDELRGWQVDGDRFPALPAASEDPAGTAGVKPHSSPALESVDKRRGFSLQRLQLSPAEFQQLRMRIVTVQGGAADGVFVGIDGDGYLVIQRRLGGGGSASYKLSPQSIQSIELLDP
ncbi:hypothetical protein [Azotobacter chroococcum]|uniref:Major facilitator superfamily permease n=1 Tax=Azotobacter chroococcum NCIMB 8003 TaxID=1328314 RepID=A0A0C4WRM9_9GAMM|nr:hypothetical protein [Azotobacter chroococcum]AJE20972.1 Major facilitator superfamily permease [Azotobacter chroococcum NCIMB 8003]